MLALVALGFDGNIYQVLLTLMKPSREAAVREGMK